MKKQDEIALLTGEMTFISTLVLPKKRRLFLKAVGRITRSMSRAHGAAIGWGDIVIDALIRIIESPIESIIDYACLQRKWTIKSYMKNEQEPSSNKVMMGFWIPVNFKHKIEHLAADVKRRLRQENIRIHFSMAELVRQAMDLVISESRAPLTGRRTQILERKLRVLEAKRAIVSKAKR